MEDISTQAPINTVVIDEAVLTDEDLRRLATVFDVFIDVDFYLKYARGAEQ